MLTSSKIWLIPHVQYINQTYLTKLEKETPWLAYIYIYIYIERERERERDLDQHKVQWHNSLSGLRVVLSLSKITQPQPTALCIPLTAKMLTKTLWYLCKRKMFTRTRRIYIQHSPLHKKQQTRHTCAKDWSTASLFCDCINFTDCLVLCTFCCKCNNFPLQIYILNKAEDHQLSISQSREKQRSEF